MKRPREPSAVDAEGPREGLTRAALAFSRQGQAPRQQQAQPAPQGLSTGTASGSPPHLEITSGRRQQHEHAAHPAPDAVDPAPAAATRQPGPNVRTARPSQSQPALLEDGAAGPSRRAVPEHGRQPETLLRQQVGQAPTSMPSSRGLSNQDGGADTVLPRRQPGGGGDVAAGSGAESPGSAGGSVYQSADNGDAAVAEAGCRDEEYGDATRAEAQSGGAGPGYAGRDAERGDAEFENGDAAGAEARQGAAAAPAQTGHADVDEAQNAASPLRKHVKWNEECNITLLNGYVRYRADRGKHDVWVTLSHKHPELPGDNKTLSDRFKTLCKAAMAGYKHCRDRSITSTVKGMVTEICIQLGKLDRNTLRPPQAAPTPGQAGAPGPAGAGPAASPRQGAAGPGAVQRGPAAATEAATAAGTTTAAGMSQLPPATGMPAGAPRVEPPARRAPTQPREQRRRKLPESFKPAGYCHAARKFPQSLHEAEYCRCLRHVQHCRHCQQGTGEHTLRNRRR